MTNNYKIEMQLGLLIDLIELMPKRIADELEKRLDMQPKSIEEVQKERKKVIKQLYG